MNQQQGYSPKDLNFGETGRNKLKSGITKISEAVKSTLGPRGNTVLIESPQHTSSITVTKDGVTVAKAIDLMDPVENLAVKMMKQAADKTASVAGDGTTTAIVLTEAIVNAGDELMSDDHNRIEVLRELNRTKDYIVESLQKESKDLSTKKLQDVATLSANNDSFIGELIAKTYSEVGKDGIVTVEKSQSAETYYESTNGLKIDRGYSSELFINNHKKDECIFDDVRILTSDAEISNVLQIEAVLKPLISDGKKLLIIAPCSQNVINTLAANVMKNSLKICVIQPPNFGYKQHELMSDIAVAVGGKYFSEKTGDDLSLINFGDLGYASRVIVGRNSSVIIKDDNRTTEDVQKRVDELWDAHAITDKKQDKEFVLSRIATLTGGIGVIHVGGDTDIQQKELYDRVDDAVCAVRSALEDGILPGGGVSLLHYAEHYKNKESNDKNKNVAYQIMAQALTAPATQILANAGKDINEIYKHLPPVDHGYDVKKEQNGNLIEMGVVDPTKVTKNALINAMSVATTILSTNAIITMARSYETN
jgi:chaperonin GroEL